MTTTSRYQPTRTLLNSAIVFLVGVTVGVIVIFGIQYFNTLSEQSKPDNAQGKVRHLTTLSENGPTTRTESFGQIQEIFERGNAFDQNTVLHTVLSNASKAELKDWWVQAKNIQRKSHRESLQNAIIRKLTTIDPQEALVLVEDVSVFQTDALLKSIFSEWAVSGLDNAVAAATNLSRLRQKVALQVILETRDDLPDGELRVIARKLKGENTFLKLVSDSKASQSIAEPEQSWHILLSDAVDDSLQSESLQIVAEAWRERVGFKVLSNIFQADMEDSRIKQQLVRSIAQTDLAEALDYTRGLPEEEQQYLSRFIAIEWASTDPRSALVAVKSFEPTALASRLEQIVTYRWAQTKPFEVIDNIESISEQLRIDTLESAFWNIASKDPLEAIALLSSVENYVGNTSTIEQQIVHVWSSLNPGAAAEWVVNQYDQEDPFRRQLLERVLPELARDDPEQAFDIAIAQPVPKEGLGIEYVVMRVITRENNIELALKFLPRVHENSKGFAYGLVAEALVRNQRTKEALVLGTELNESQQQYFHHQVFDAWAKSNPKSLFESLDSLESDAYKSLAAFQLIFANRWEPVLTDEQINHARTFLNSEDAATLKRVEEQL